MNVTTQRPPVNGGKATTPAAFSAKKISAAVRRVKVTIKLDARYLATLETMVCWSIRPGKLIALEAGGILRDIKAESGPDDNPSALAEQLQSQLAPPTDGEVVVIEFDDADFRRVQSAAKHAKMSRDHMIRSAVMCMANRQRIESEEEAAEAEWKASIPALPLLDQLVCHYVETGHPVDVWMVNRYWALRAGTAWLRPIKPAKPRPFKVKKLSGKRVKITMMLPKRHLANRLAEGVTIEGILRSMTVWGSDSLVRADVEECWFGSGNFSGTSLTTGVAMLEGLHRVETSFDLTAALFASVSTAAEAVGASIEEWILGCLGFFRLDTRHPDFQIDRSNAQKTLNAKSTR